MKILIEILKQIDLLLLLVLVLIVLFVLFFAIFGLGGTWIKQYLKQRFSTPRKEIDVIEDIDRANTRRMNSTDPNEKQELAFRMSELFKELGNSYVYWSKRKKS